MSEGHPDYAATIDWLYRQLPMFSRIGAAALKPDLTNTIALCKALDNPERKFPSIHIAGTNGKGSTSHMLAAIFAAAGYKTGLYTSPHLVDFRERIRINGMPVGQGFVVDFVRRYKAIIESIEPSFFEITVAIAFDAFAMEGVDIAIIETGLGGRLDSTNVIIPELSIITNISLDHTDLLGKDIASIAKEKAGIIKESVPVVIGEYDAASFPVFEEKAKAVSAPLTAAWRSWQVTDETRGQSGPGTVTYHCHSDKKDIILQTDLQGGFQQKNLRTVLAAIDVMNGKGWNISDEVLASALPFVSSKTGLRGRLDTLQQNPLILADVAHNPAGIGVLMEHWKTVKAAWKHILLGFVRDKDVRAALSLFPVDCQYHFCAADTPRALPAQELQAIAEELSLSGTTYDSVATALEKVRQVMEAEDALLITGSFFIVGDAMQAMGIAP